MIEECMDILECEKRLSSVTPRISLLGEIPLSTSIPSSRIRLFNLPFDHRNGTVSQFSSSFVVSQVINRCSCASGFRSSK